MRNGTSFAADEAETKAIYKKKNHHKKGTTGIRNLNGNMTAKNKKIKIQFGFITPRKTTTFTFIHGKGTGRR